MRKPSLETIGFLTFLLTSSDAATKTISASMRDESQKMEENTSSYHRMICIELAIFFAVFAVWMIKRYHETFKNSDQSLHVPSINTSDRLSSEPSTPTECRVGIFHSVSEPRCYSAISTDDRSSDRSMSLITP